MSHAPGGTSGRRAWGRRRSLAWVLAAALPAIALAPGARAGAVAGGAPADPAVWHFAVPLLDAGTADPVAATFCSGALVAPAWALTAATCVEGRAVAGVQVGAPPGAGLSAIAPDGRIAVDRVVLYPFRDPSIAPSHDLALLRLVRPAGTPAALPQGARYAEGRKLATVAGWGATGPAGAGVADGLTAADVGLLASSAASARAGIWARCARRRRPAAYRPPARRTGAGRWRRRRGPAR